MTFMIGFGKLSIFRESSASDGFKCIIVLVIAESSQKVDFQQCVISGHVQNMCNISPLCPHSLQHLLSSFVLYLDILSGVRYQCCVSLMGNSHRVEQHVAFYVALQAFSHCSTIQVPPRSASHLISGVVLVNTLFCWKRLQKSEIPFWHDEGVLKKIHVSRGMLCDHDGSMAIQCLVRM